MLTRTRECLDRLRTKIERQEGAREAAVTALAKAQEDVELATEAADTHTRAHKLLQAAAHALRDRMKGALEDIGTQALRAVFNDPTYRVEFRLEAKRGRLYATPWVFKDGVGAPVLEGHGGGVANVLSYVFRAAVVRSMPGPKLLVLDECAAWINTQDALTRLSGLFSALGNSGVQHILVSSREDFASVDGARVFRFKPTPDGTKVKQEG